MQININVYDLTKVETITIRSSFRPVRTSPSAVRLITAQLLFILSRTSLIAYSPHKGFIFSIKARAKPHGSYIENFLPWRRRYEILCSSGENNISWLRAANEWYIVLSRNSLKIFRSYRVFFQVLSHSCCLENAFTSSSFTCPYHNNSKQQTNQVHSAKFEKWESWRRCSIRPLVLHTKSRTLGSKMTPWCSDRIDSESVLVSAINTPVQLIFSVLFFGSLQSARQRGVRGTVRGVRGMRGTQKIKKILKKIYKNIKKKI